MPIQKPETEHQTPISRILVTGSSGLVGSRFVELYPNKADLLTPDEKQLDITDASSVAKFFSENPVDVVVNFAAYTNLTEGENQRGKLDSICYLLNYTGVTNLLKSASDAHARHFVQISTDCVFSASPDNPGPYTENTPPETDPSRVTWYGYTKSLGEQVVAKSTLSTTILRLIYPVRAKYTIKLDYLRKHLTLYRQGKLYPLFSDQHLNICFTDEACRALSVILDKKLTGIYHAASSDITTPDQLIGYFIAKATGEKPKISTHLLTDYLKADPARNPVRYPQFGGLEVKLTQKALGLKFSTWREIIDQILAQGIEL